MGNFFTSYRYKSRNYYRGIDSMQLLSDDERRENHNIVNAIEETKSDISNTTNLVKFLEENTTANIKSISDDVHHLNQQTQELRLQIKLLEEKLSEVLQVNRILSNKINNQKLIDA